MSHVELVQRVYAAFGRGQVEAVLAAFDPQIEWHLAEGHPYEPGGRAWVGPGAVREKLFERIGAEWDGFTVHPQIFHDAGVVVVVEGRYTGTCKSTGKSLDAQLCHVWTIRNGKVARFQQFVDTAQLQDVIGAR